MKTKDLMQMSAAQLVMLAQDNQIRIEELEKQLADAKVDADREKQHEFSMKQFKNCCAGTNCRASDAFPHSHSIECKAEHDAVYAAMKESKDANEG